MEPTAQPAPTPAPRPQPVVEFFRTNRQNASMILLGVSLLFLVLAGWGAVKASRMATAPLPADKDKQDKPDVLNPEDGPAKVADPNRSDYIVTAAGSAVVFIIIAAGATWFMVRPPVPGVAQQNTEIRQLLLLIGGTVGLVFILCGVAFFYLWIGSLSEWLDKGEVKQARWVLIPLLMVVGGAGLAFAAVQPARAEERSNNGLRKLVYGTNFGLSVLLLFVALVAANVALGRKIPNRLDTTVTAFYSLAPSSEEFLSRLTQPVTAYGILPESGDRGVEDIRRLLRNCADVSGTQFKVKFINPSMSKAEHSTLKTKYPVLGVNDFGVLLTFGEDEKRHTFLRAEDLFEVQRGAPGAPSSESFVGEARLMREMLFLAENQQKAVVYFTQSAGELDLAGSGEEVSPAQAISRLKAFLERNYLEVRPLKFEVGNAKVPDDAAVVVVAGPRSPLSDEAVAAIKRYMTQPLPDGRKGKLIVLAGARFGADRKLIRTGLEGVLADFSIQLTDRAIFGAPSRELDIRTSQVAFSLGAVQAKNPIAMALGEKFDIEFPDWRLLGRVNAPPGGPFRTVPLLLTVPGRATWLETEQPDIERVIAELQTRPEVRAAKNLNENGRIVAMVTSEGDTGRVAVYGNSLLFTDAVRGRGDRDPIVYDLMSATIDWLRDRPSLGTGVEAKKYKEFTLPGTTDDTRALWLPLLLMLLVVGGAGAGVWIIRRK